MKVMRIMVVKKNLLTVELWTRISFRNSNILDNVFVMGVCLLSVSVYTSVRRQVDLFCRPSSVSGSPLANGKMHLHSSAKRKLAEEKGYVFDKRLRYNVRQNESNCRFRDIVVRKEEGFTHVLLSSQTTDNNALTPEVRTYILSPMFLCSVRPTFNYVALWLYPSCHGALFWKI